MSVNKVFLIGRLGKNPEMRVTKDGAAVANFSMVTNKKSRGEEVATWHDCVAWREQADFCGEYLKKGDQVFVEGEIVHEEWTAKDQTKRKSTKINCFKVDGVGARS